MGCCPFMKKCVETSQTSCTAPVASCRPPCHESTSGAECKCSNSDFPVTWLGKTCTPDPDEADDSQVDEDDNQRLFENFRFVVTKASDSSRTFTLALVGTAGLALVMTAAIRLIARRRGQIAGPLVEEDSFLAVE